MVEVSRADVHAALAEPHRLAIVDALALEDLSPTELGERTDQPSNLLAHHLHVLERAGVVRRRRSDRDGRRTYLTLAWENPVVASTAVQGIARAVAPAGTRVVFVCSANSARSQFAASQFAACLPATMQPAAGQARASQSTASQRAGNSPSPAAPATRGAHGAALTVASAGTEPAARIHPLALAELHARGLSPLTPTPASADTVLRPHDIVVAVCDHAYEDLGRSRVDLHWSIPDPAGGGPDDFATAFDTLTPRVARLADALT